MATKADGPTPRPLEPPARGLALGKIAGVQVVADWSLLIIFALVSASLGLQVLPSWHPDWSPALRWVVAIAAAVAFFASVLAHELSHALVGRRFGIEVRRITLFLFGGMAHMENHPPKPSAELWMAAVGPLTSFVIGVASIVVVSFSASPELRALAEIDMIQAMAALGPVETVLAWLGPINILLAVFNLVPGFPLDGGRVLRALLWAITNDLHRATRWATAAGQGIAVLLMTLGVAMSLGVYVPLLGVGFGSGIWMVFIGWFLFKAAKMSWNQLLTREALGDARIGDLMRRRVYTVPEDASVEAFVRDYVMNSDQGAFPVTREGRLIGMADAQAVGRVPRELWGHTPVAAIAEGGRAIETVSADASAEDAVQRLGAGVKQLAVVDQGERLVGIVRQQDLIKFLSLRTQAQPG